jgi:homoserine kinase type II
MAVYTELSLEQASALVATALDEAVGALEPLPGGIENSNYRVATDQRTLVLTVVERQDAERLAAPLAWMDALNDAGLPVPQLLAADLSIGGRPVILCSWCDGEHLSSPNAAQVSAVGALLAEMHGRPSEKPLPPDAHDHEWYAARISAARGALAGEDLAILNAAVAISEELATDSLPSGAIHADVFLDNLLFDGDTVTGLVDFLEGCNGPFLFDLAVAANDLCTREDGSVDADLEAALLWGYQGVRRLSEAEIGAWRRMLALAALRFWLSRLWDRDRPRPGPLPLTKDPDEFRRRLRARIDS